MTLSQLPQAVQPIHYDLSIITNFAESTFSGTVVIRVKALERVESVMLNSQVKILKASVNGKEVQHSQHEDITTLETAVEKGEAELRIKFTSKIGTGMAGFYKSRDGIWSTHFEPSDARKAFPCFDQPDMKATFKVTLTAPKHLTVLSNMGVENEFNISENYDPAKEESLGAVFSPKDFEKADFPSQTELKTLVFETTPRMSTYLLAFVIGPLEYIEDGRLRVYALKGRAEDGRFSLEIGKKCLEFFEKYFDIPYPLKKMDMVSIPEFAMGAMENWGLITYRASSLLFTKESSLNTKKGIAETVCHELAHQWFGNLVTMNWWNDLWLNEGFATWASILAIQNIYTEWEVMPSFISECQGGLEHDALLSTHPIETDGDPTQIFDPISYSKGAALIRMIEDHDKTKFRSGLTKYLKEKAYQNATSGELCKYLGVDIDTWIKKSGYPLVILGKDNTLSQTRFTFLRNCKDIANLKVVEHPTDKQDTAWNIPVKIDWLDGKTDYVELATKSMKIEPKTPLFKINSDQVGFYRVKYEDTEIPFKLLQKVVDTNDRLGIYNDLHALTLSCDYTIPHYVKVIDFLANEKNFDVYSEVMGGMGEMKSIFYDKKEYFEKIILQASVVDFNFESLDQINEMALRSLKVKMAVLNKNTEVIARILKEDVAPAYRASKFIAMIKSGDSAMFDKLMEIYSKSAVPDERSSALIACGYNVEKALGLVAQLGSTIMLQDAHYLFIGLSSNHVLREAVVDTVMEKWDHLRELFKESTSIMSFIIERVFSATPLNRYDTVMKFLDQAHIRGVEMSVENAKETMRIYKNVREFNDDLIK